MADDDVIVAEVEADPIEPNNKIADLLQAIGQKDYNSAENQFKDIVNDRLQTAMDQHKIRLANSIYGYEDEVEDETEFEVEDETEFEDEDETEFEDDELTSDEQS